MDYIFVESVRGLQVTQDEYEALTATINIANSEDDWSVQFGDWVTYYSNGEVYIGGVFQNSWRTPEGEFLALLGTLIAKNGLDCLTFRIVIEWPPEYGVTAFRVTREGSLWHPTLTGWLYDNRLQNDHNLNNNENPENN